MTIETKLKYKERSIRKMNYKAKDLEAKLLGLDEARAFCDIHRSDIADNNSNIKCNLNTYKNYGSWPKNVGGKLGRGSFAYITLRYENYYCPDSNEAGICIKNESIELFDKCYVQMRNELYNELEDVKIKLKALYEEYGRLSFECKQLDV